MKLRELIAWILLAGLLLFACASEEYKSMQAERVKAVPEAVPPKLRCHGHINMTTEYTGDVELVCN